MIILYLLRLEMNMNMKRRLRFTLFSVVVINKVKINSLLFVFFVFIISTTMSQGVAEGFVVNETFFVWLGQFEELFEFIVVESVGLRFQDFLEGLNWDDTFVVFVEEFEGFDNNVFWVGTVEFVGQHVQEDGEVDWGAGFSAHVVEHVLVEIPDTKGSVGGFQITDGDDTISIGIDHLESFFEFLNLGLFELGEDIGGGSLLFSAGFLGHFEVFFRLLE